MYDAASPEDRAELLELGVRADVSGVLLDGSGRAVDAPLARRVIGISAGQLRHVPEVVALAYGLEKTAAVGAAIAGGYVSGLVTHSALAQALLAHSAGHVLPEPASAGTGESGDVR
jgi:DNA-binding transcriptional regulator LsrR (DeoR family)